MKNYKWIIYVVIVLVVLITIFMIIDKLSSGKASLTKEEADLASKAMDRGVDKSPDITLGEAEVKQLKTGVKSDISREVRERMKEREQTYAKELNSLGLADGKKTFAAKIAMLRVILEPVYGSKIFDTYEEGVSKFLAKLLDTQSSFNDGIAKILSIDAQSRIAMQSCESPRITYIEAKSDLSIDVKNNITDKTYGSFSSLGGLAFKGTYERNIYDYSTTHVRDQSITRVPVSTCDEPTINAAVEESISAARIQGLLALCATRRAAVNLFPGIQDYLGLSDAVMNKITSKWNETVEKLEI